MKPMTAIKRIALAAALAGLLTGCASNLIAERPAPVSFRLDYDSPALQVAGGFGRELRVWRFSAARPYDGRAMAVLSGDRQVTMSSRYRWIDAPGGLLADRLARDLAAGGLFAGVVGAASPESAPLELSGRVETFAWQRRKQGGRAVLAVRVTLSESGGGVLFQHRYRLQSETEEEYSPEAFAAAMGGLARDFSAGLQRDLADVAGGG